MGCKGGRREVKEAEGRKGKKKGGKGGRRKWGRREKGKKNGGKGGRREKMGEEGR